MPEVRYARSGDVHVAYQVVGDGPVDIVFVAGFLTHLPLLWEYPGYRRFVERLGSFARVLLFDKRGMGLSDRVQVGTLEERMDDVRAVMDAAGSERAALLGVSEGGPMSLLFAATYPERTTALLLCGAEIREETTDDWPWGEATRQEFEEFIPTMIAGWGSRSLRAEHYAPDLPAEDVRQFEDWSRRLLVEAASPGAVDAFVRMAFEIDVRDVLPSIDVPTLIVHREGDRICHVENARYTAARVSGAHYVELPGANHIPWVGEGEEIAAEIQEFLTGVREAPEPSRVLATVLFTDLVGSTGRAVELGDARWRDLLERHNTAIRRELERFRGREIDTAGDGFLAAFDGPARAIRCAQAIREAVAGLDLELRAGIHTGECEVIGGKLAGIAVHVGARVASQAQAGEILASSTVKDLVAGSAIRFEERGPTTLEGVPGEWRLFAVAD